MDIYSELEKDHKKVLALVDELVAAEKSDDKTRNKLIGQIRDELIPHARAEEAVLYNSIRDIETASGVVAHAYTEHLEAETILRSLQVTGAVNMTWVAGAKKLKEALSHHIAEEEGEVFAAAKKLFIEEEAVAMGEVFKKMKPMVKEQSLLGTSMDMLANLMPSRLRPVFGKFDITRAAS
jgi:hemerythrin superfamily protein